MHGLLATPLAKLLELDFALNFLPIFAAPIVDAFAHTALELYQLVLRHSENNLSTEIILRQ